MPACARAFICEGSQDGVCGTEVRDGYHDTPYTGTRGGRGRCAPPYRPHISHASRVFLWEGDARLISCPEFRTSENLHPWVHINTVAEGVAGREQEDEGTFERWKMGGEVEGRGGRASVGKATAIGGGKTRKIAGYPSITALPPRTGVSRHFSIPFSPIFALRTSVFYVSLFRSPFFFFVSKRQARASVLRGRECAPASARQRAALSVSKIHGTSGSISR